MGKTKKTTDEDLSGGSDELVDSSLFPKNPSANGVEDAKFSMGEEFDENDLPAQFRTVKEDEEIEEEVEDVLEEEEIEEQEEEIEKEEPKKIKQKKVEEPADEEIEEGEGSQVGILFEAIAEEAGWAFEEDEVKPQTAEELVNYFQKVIEENSTPEYSDDRVAQLDEYIKNGGKFEDFYSMSVKDIDYETVDLTDEGNQKAVLADFLEAKGFDHAQINKKISKYEGAGLLEDEAEDALDALKEIKKQEKENLLKNQKEEKKAFDEQQRSFYNSVVEQIENLEDIRGVAIKKSDKKELLDYIFKIESDGLTKYRKDYNKSTKNLIESAYFTMKGDSLISSAKKSGETSATTRLRNSLTTTKVKGTTQKLTSSAPRPIWEQISLIKQ